MTRAANVGVRAQINGKKTVTPKPETEEYNVRNFVYSNSRPFHPRRLWRLLYDKFILQIEHEDEEGEDGQDEETTVDGANDGDEDETMDDDDADDDDDDEPLDPPSNEVILKNKSASPLFKRLFRSKGEFFLATRPGRAGEWSQAGAVLAITGGREWFCTLPQEEYLTGNSEIDALVMHDLQKGGDWGDRRQELVFIGENLDVAGIQAALDECVLTNEEFEAWCLVMRNEGLGNGEKQEALQDLFDDGWPDWPEEDAHDHDHEGHKH